jgi:hypothetical protein
MTVRAERPEQDVFTFQAEAVRILDLMVHSLYSNKEIFLRELISNAADAIDRLRLELLSRSEMPEAEGPLRIRVSYNKDARASPMTIQTGSRSPGSCASRRRSRPRTSRMCRSAITWRG